MKLILLLASITGVCFAEDTQSLGQTKLYKSIATGCISVDLMSWSHPTKSLLIKKGVKLEQVQLCNKNRYPVFYVEFPYDPQGQTVVVK